MDATTLTLRQFASANLLVTVWSEVLGERILFASDGVEPPEGNDLVVYRAEELGDMIGLDEEGVKEVHRVKGALQSSGTDLIDSIIEACGSKEDAASMVLGDFMVMVAEFLRQFDLDSVSKSSIVAMIKAGAIGSETSNSFWLDSIDEAYDLAKRMNRESESGQISL